MPPKSMSVIFILFTKGFILGILGCADERLYSFCLYEEIIIKYLLYAERKALLPHKSYNELKIVGSDLCEKIPCLSSTR